MKQSTDWARQRPSAFTKALQRRNASRTSRPNCVRMFQIVKICKDASHSGTTRWKDWERGHRPRPFAGLASSYPTPPLGQASHEVGVPWLVRVCVRARVDACARGLACPERGELTLVGPLTRMAGVRVSWAIWLRWAWAMLPASQPWPPRCARTPTQWRLAGRGWLVSARGAGGETRHTHGTASGETAQSSQLAQDTRTPARRVNGPTRVSTPLSGQARPLARASLPVSVHAQLATRARARARLPHG